MPITNLNTPFQGIPAQDYFVSRSRDFVPMGSGYIIPSVQEDLFPERPLQFYIHIDAQPSARCELLGALLARVTQMREHLPPLKARVYANVPANAQELLFFYKHNGFDPTDSMDEYSYPLLSTQVPQAPIGCEFASVPLASVQEQQRFLQRLNQYRLTPITHDYLAIQMQQPYFMALGYYRGGQPVAELLVSGARPEAAALVMVYVRPEARNRGIGKALTQSAGALLSQNGVRKMVAQVYASVTPQVRLIRSLGGERNKIVAFFPSIEIG